MKKKEILVVDDESSIKDLVTAIFELEGYSVRVASSGEVALRILKDYKPDLAIIDMMMPKMSGRELCELIRKDSKTKDLKVVFLTVARFSESGKDVLKELNVSDYITKPFENEDLVKRIKKVLG